MNSFIQRARAFAGRAVGEVGGLLKRFGDTGAAVVRTIGAHRPALQSFVTQMGSNFGAPGQYAADLVNKGIDTLSSDRAGKIADKIARFGQSLNTYR